MGRMKGRRSPCTLNVWRGQVMTWGKGMANWYSTSEGCSGSFNTRKPP